MFDFLDKLADVFRFERFSNIFRENEEFIMTKGLRIVAIACLVIALFYAFVTYVQFSRF